MTINEALEAASLQALMEQMAEGPKVPVPSQKARAAEHEAALENVDLDHMLKMAEKMKDAVTSMVSNIIDFRDSGPLLSSEALAALMIELNDAKDIEKLLKARYEKMIRPAIFTHITETLAANGVEDPQYAQGEAPVPELGLKFTRVGGRAKLTLDHTRLAEALGEERWNQVHITTIIPERRETKLDEDALLALVASDPSVLETFKACVRIDGRTPQQLRTEKIGDDA